MRRTRLVAIPVILLALIAACGGTASRATAGKPPGNPVSATKPPRHGDGVSVGIAYSGGFLVLTSERAGRAQIVLRSADGRRHWLEPVKLSTPTTRLRLKTLFPTITKGRYRIVVRPLFHGGFLSGGWITVS